MAAFDFPASPLVNDTYTANGVTYEWDGTVWNRVPSTFINDGSYVYYTGALNVGVGTATPTSKFTVQGTTTLNGAVDISGDFLVGTNDLFVNDTLGRVGIGTITPSVTLEVNGDFAATTKSFLITHPLDPSKKLRYGSLEGPENGVYIRGRATNNKIQLPDYWTALVDETTITVTLTAIGNQTVYVKDVNINEITVSNSWWNRLFGKKIDCYYTIYAERNDVAKLVVEV